MLHSLKKGSLGFYTESWGSVLGQKNPFSKIGSI